MNTIVKRLRASCLDRDNYPYMDNEIRVRVGLAKEAADYIERIVAASSKITCLHCQGDQTARCPKCSDFKLLWVGTCENG